MGVFFTSVASQQSSAAINSLSATMGMFFIFHVMD